MKFTVVRDAFEPKTVFFTEIDASMFGDNTVGTIDLPIENPKEEKKTFIPENDYDLDLFVKYLKENGFKPKKKLVTKVVDCDGYIVARLKSTNDLPKDAKNPRIVFEVEE